MTTFTNALLLSTSLLSLPVMAMGSGTAIGGPANEDADQPHVVARGAGVRLDTTKEDTQPRGGLYTTRGVFPEWDGYRTTSKVVTIPPNTTDEELLAGIGYYKHLRVLNVSNALHLTVQGIVAVLIQYPHIRGIIVSNALSPEDEEAIKNSRRDNLVTIIKHQPWTQIENRFVVPSTLTDATFLHDFKRHYTTAQALDLSRAKNLTARGIMNAINTSGVTALTLPQGMSPADVVSLVAACPGVTALTPLERVTEDMVRTAHAALIASGRGDDERVLHALRGYYANYQKRINYVDKADFAAKFELSSSLVTSFYFDGINTANIQGMMETLGAQAPFVTSLSTGGNRIGDAGAKALAAAFLSVPHLRVLNLGNNSIGDAGAKDLAAAFLSVPHLRVLYLYNNSIGDAGARALAAVLPRFTQLQTLDLYNNSIDVAGAEALAAVLPRLTQLQTLDLSYNNIGVDGKAAIQAAIDAINADRIAAENPLLEVTF